MAVVVGEAAVRIRPEVDAGEFRSEVEGPVSSALEDAGGGGAAKFTAAFGAALAIGGAFAQSLEDAALGDKLAAQLGATGAESERYGQVAGDLYAGAYGDSLGDVNDAIKGVVQNIGGMADASAADLQTVTGSVMDLATAMDQDVGATSQAVGRMIQTGLAGNAQEALDILTRGFQEGADRGGDLLDVVGEYGTTFSELGLTGASSMGLINQALAAGIPNADFAADALREMGIIAREGGEEASTALQSLGLNAGDYFAAMQKGGPEASAALDTVLDALRNTEDPAVRAAAATALVGTQYEDLGDAILQMDPSEAAAGLGQIEGAAGRMGATLNDNANTNLTTFTRTLQTAFVDIVGGKVVPLIEGAASLLATVFGPAIAGIGAVASATVIPAFQAMGQFIAEHQTTFTIIAALITAVFVPALISMGIAAVISGSATAAGWAASAAGAVTSLAGQSLAAVSVVAGWVSMAASAVINAAIVVGGWVLMGAQALLAAGRMAAAWLIALGPIGLLVAGIVAVVALVIVYWDQIVAATTAAWTAVGNALVVAWEWIKSVFAAALQFIVDWFLNWTLLGLIISHWDAIQQAFVTAIDAIVAFVSEFPGRVIAALAALGQMVSDVATAAWTWFSDTTRGIVDAIVTYVTEFPGNLVRGLANMGANISEVARAAWQWFSDVTGGLVNSVVTVVTGIPGRFVAGLVTLGSTIAEVARAAWQWFYDNVATKVGEVVAFVGGLPGKIVSAIGNLGSLLVQKGRDLIQGLVDGIASAAGYVGNVARNIVNGVIRFINSSVIGGLNSMLQFDIMGVHIDAPDIPRIPLLHSGGVFDSGQGEGLALLRDDELVATPEQRRVADDLLRGLLDGRLALPDATTAPAAGGPPVEVNVYPSPGMDERVLAAHVSTDLGWQLSTGSTRTVPLLEAAR